MTDAEILPPPAEYRWHSTPPAEVVEGIIARTLHEVTQVLDLAPQSGAYPEGGSGSRLPPDRIVRAAALIAAAASAEWAEVAAQSHPATLRPKHRQVFEIWRAAAPRLVAAIDRFDAAGQGGGAEASAAMARTLLAWVEATHLLLHERTSPKDRAEIVRDYLGEVLGEVLGEAPGG